MRRPGIEPGSTDYKATMLIIHYSSNAHCFFGNNFGLCFRTRHFQIEKYQLNNNLERTTKL